MNMKKQFFIIILTAISVLGLFFGVHYLLAWSNPILNPPSGNISPPINEGTTTQVKDGSLGITGNFSIGGASSFIGNVSIGTTDSGANLEINYVGPDMIKLIHTPDEDYTVINLDSAGDFIIDTYGSHSTVSPGQYVWKQNGVEVMRIKAGALYVDGLIYDSDNTDYYVDPAGTSKFNSINLGGESRDSWPIAGCVAFTADSNQCGGYWCGRGFIDRDADYFCHSKGFNFAIRYTTKVVSGGYFRSYTGVWPTYSDSWTDAHSCNDCTVLDIVVCC